MVVGERRQDDAEGEAAEDEDDRIGDPDPLGNEGQRHRDDEQEQDELDERSDP